MNHTTQTFARRMGERYRGAEYACAISGPRSNANHPIYWLLAFAAPFIGWGILVVVL